MLQPKMAVNDMDGPQWKIMATKAIFENCKNHTNSFRFTRCSCLTIHLVQKIQLCIPYNNLRPSVLLLKQFSMYKSTILSKPVTFKSVSQFVYSRQQKTSSVLFLPPPDSFKTPSRTLTLTYPTYRYFTFTLLRYTELYKIDLILTASQTSTLLMLLEILAESANLLLLF